VEEQSKLLFISVVYRRQDLYIKQREAFKKYCNADLLLAAFHDSQVANRHIRIPKTRYQVWPLAYVEAVGFLLEKFYDEDVLIVEGDIWPIVEINFDKWPDFVMRDWNGKPWPGLVFRRKYVEIYEFWKEINSVHLNDILPHIDAHLLSYTVEDDHEIINDQFYHVNGGDKSPPSDVCPHRVFGCCGEPPSCKIKSGQPCVFCFKN